MTKLFEVYLEACEARFELKSKDYGNDAHKALFPMFMDGVAMSYDGTEDVQYPSVLVDDFLMNGSGYCKDDCSEEEWEDVCRRSIVHNDRYAVAY